MFLKNNVMASNLFSSYNKSLFNQNKSINKISSGIKLSNSGDNPIGMQKSENLRNRIRSLEASQRNIQQSVSFVQTIDNSLQEIDNALNQMKELVTQSGNGTLSDDELKSIQENINETINFIEDVSKREFNGKEIFTNGTSMEIVAGDQALQMPIKNLTNAIADIKTIDVKNANNNMDKIDKMLKEVNELRVDYGSLQNSLDVIYKTNEQNITINERVDSSIRDTDISAEFVEYSKESLLVDAKMAMMAQITELPQNILDTINRI